MSVNWVTCCIGVIRSSWEHSSVGWQHAHFGSPALMPAARAEGWFCLHVKWVEQPPSAKCAHLDCCPPCPGLGSLREPISIPLPNMLPQKWQGSTPQSAKWSQVCAGLFREASTVSGRGDSLSGAVSGTSLPFLSFWKREQVFEEGHVPGIQACFVYKWSLSKLEWLFSNLEMVLLNVLHWTFSFSII